MCTEAKSKECPFPCVCFLIENIPLSKPLKSFCLPVLKVCAFSKFNNFFFLFRVFAFGDSLNLSVSFLKFICSSNTSSSVSLL